jgi:hypothetical protein
MTWSAAAGQVKARGADLVGAVSQRGRLLARRDRYLTEAIGSLRPSPGRAARLTQLYRSGAVALLATFVQRQKLAGTVPRH